MLAGVLIIGAGGLGCAAGLALARGGGVRLTVADADRIALSNLHRQILYRAADIGREKVERFVEALAELAPALEIHPLPRRLEGMEAIADAARGHGVILDASDNTATRFAANDAALATGIPLVHGAASGFAGQVMTILPGRSACLRCLFPEPPDTAGPTCRDEGVLAPLVGEVGWLMALEALKLIRGAGAPLLDRLLTINALSGRRREVIVPRNPRCPCAATRHPLTDNPQRTSQPPEPP